MKFYSLPFINILGKKSRSISLLIFAFLLSFTIFGGVLIFLSLKNGLNSIEQRLGADIIVVPYEARTKVSADTILNQGNRTYFYMSKSKLEKIKAIEGVEKVSPQIYLCSMNAGCCSVSLQLIGFEPETDFTIQPWMRENFKGNLGLGDILIGSKVSMPYNRKLKFFNTTYNVASQLEETGTGLDNAVYASLETIDMLIESAKTQNISFTDKSYNEKMISSVMVKVKEGYDIDNVASLIQRRVNGTQAVKSKSMTSGIASSLANTAKIIFSLMLVIWILCLIILIVVTNLIIGERKKEFAILRVIGTDRKKLSRLVILESLILNATGGLAGIFGSILCIIPFNSMIKKALSLPFLLPEAGIILLLMTITLLLSILSGAITSSYAARKISQIDTGIILREGV